MQRHLDLRGAGLWDSIAPPPESNALLQQQYGRAVDRITAIEHEAKKS